MVACAQAACPMPKRVYTTARAAHMRTDRMLDDLDLSIIGDEPARQAIQLLLNLVETLSAENRALREENQRLRDENNRLKGEQGKPDIKPNTKAKASLSSEKERRASKTHHKANKQANIRIDRVEVVKVDEEHV